MRLDRLGNNRTVSATLEMPEAGVVRVYAIGELIPSQRFDYGWITAEDGSVLWEMTRANTHPAGGSQKNRAFDGPVRLPAGTRVEPDPTFPTGLGVTLPTPGWRHIRVVDGPYTGRDGYIPASALLTDERP